MSAILSADDLNDFISPGLACIKPVEIQKSSDNAEIEIDTEGNPYEVSIDGSTKTSLTAAQISLSDCLACSGCITSAEEILVAQHSHNELLKHLKNNSENKVFVASVSNQSRASLATAFNTTVEEVDRCLVDLFINKLGFRYIIGSSFGRKLSLIYESQTTIQRKRQQDSQSSQPILSSICPGWVCYAEKTHPFILPLISTTKSPQQITGFCLKELASKELNISRDSIYHLSIMPCFDKKLEAARPEKGDYHKEIDVDCVITAKELVQLLEQENLTFNQNLNPSVLNCSIDDLYLSAGPSSLPFVVDSWLNDQGSMSGGYSFDYLLTLKNDLSSSVPVNNLEIITISGKNSDTLEMRLINSETGEVYGKSCYVNGFRNIQNLIRRLKPEKKSNPLVIRRNKLKAAASVNKGESADASKCDYVEIMACPGGCINGGGQIANRDGDQKEWLRKVEESYISISLRKQTNEKYVKWMDEFCQQFGISRERMMYTYFNEIEKPSDPSAVLLGAKW